MTPPARPEPGPARALLGVPLLLTASLLAWFCAWPTPATCTAVAAVTALGALVCAWVAWPAPRRPRAPSRETVIVLAIALAYRLPALVHPWGWVNTDGAYGAFVALHLMEGARPAPVFTEGASYQGTLKGHLAALLSLMTGAQDLSRTMVTASLLLDLVFIAATMSLARRIGGRAAAVAAGLYLALGPKFLTVFSLNSVGQYVDVLALGGLALALVAPVLAGEIEGDQRLRLFAVGALLGAAFWQQPVALCYAIAVGASLALCRRPGRAARWAWTALGVLVGGVPVLVWNARNDWATGALLGPDGGGLRSQAAALPYLVRRTLGTSLPVLAGVSPGHPWLDFAGGAVRAVAALLLPLLFVAFLVRYGRAIVESIRDGRPSPAILPPLLTMACLALVWATASGAVYSRPRYLLPLMAAAAVQLGALWSRAWARSRPLAGLALAAILALSVSGTIPRLRDGGPTSAYYRRVLRSLEAKGVRTGYADFSLSAPITMFTRERILLSSRLGPTPAYEPEEQTRRVEREGPDAYVLRPDDDPERFAATLRGLGVTYRVDLDPVPVFYGFSRRVRVEEVSAFRGAEAAAPADEE